MCRFRHQIHVSILLSLDTYICPIRVTHYSVDEDLHLLDTSLWKKYRENISRYSGQKLQNFSKTFGTSNVSITVTSILGIRYPIWHISCSEACASTLQPNIEANFLITLQIVFRVSLFKQKVQGSVPNIYAVTYRSNAICHMYSIGTLCNLS